MAGPGTDSVGTADAYEAVFTALAHPARRRILIGLNFAGGAMTAGEIAGLFAHAWPTTTRHLQLLEAAGIVRHERKGRTRVYRMDARRLRLAGDWLAWFDRDPLTAKEKHSDRRNEGEPAQAVPDQHRGRRH